MLAPLKKFIIALAVTICILLLFFGFAYYNGAFIFSRLLSGKLGTKVTIEQVNFKSEEIEIIETKIKNPRKSTVPFALQIKNIDVKAPYSNYIKEDIVFNEIILSDVHLVVEFFTEAQKESNWNHIMNDLDSSPEARVESRSKRDALIKRLEIRNFTVEVIMPGKKNRTKNLGTLRFQNVQTEKGEIVRRITQAILMKMIFNMKNFIELPLEITEDSFKKVFEGLDFINPFKKSSQEK